jgi:hypothetical protein
MAMDVTEYGILWTYGGVLDGEHFLNWPSGDLRALQNSFLAVLGPYTCASY